jgi:hypothetical protein
MSILFSNHIPKDRAEDRKKHHSDDPKNFLFGVFIAFHDIDDHKDIDDKDNEGY